MRLSAKTRYGLACLLYMADKNQRVTTQQMAQDLELPYLFLQQVLTTLKTSDIITSFKGSTGGYILNKKSEAITLYECIASLEPALLEENEPSTANEDYQSVLDQEVYHPLSQTLKSFLENITLSDLERAIKKHQGDALMFYI